MRAVCGVRRVDGLHVRGGQGRGSPWTGVQTSELTNPGLCETQRLAGRNAVARQLSSQSVQQIRAIVEERLPPFY